MPVAKLITRLCLFAALICAALVMLAVGVGERMPIPALAYISDIPNDYSARSIYLLDANTGRTQLVFQANGINSLSRSPDGQRVVFVQHGDGASYIDVVDVNGRNRSELISGIAGEPVWSPDGKRILFATTQYENQIIHLIDPNGQEIQQIMLGGLDTYGHIGSVVWSSDNTRIAFVSNQGDNSYIYGMSLSDNQTQEFVNNLAGELEDLTFLSISWSPDGCCLAMGSNGGLYTIDIRDKAITRILEGYYDQVDWSDDGN